MKKLDIAIVSISILFAALLNKYKKKPKGGPASPIGGSGGE
jgi:hypothetical protein